MGARTFVRISGPRPSSPWSRELLPGNHRVCLMSAPRPITAATASASPWARRRGSLSTIFPLATRCREKLRELTLSGRCLTCTFEEKWIQYHLRDLKNSFQGHGRGGFRGGRTGPRHEFGDGDTNGVEGGYGGLGFGDGGVLRREDGEEKASERGHGPCQPYRGSGRRGGYTGVETGDESGRAPQRAYERRSGTGRGYGMKREGAGRGNWGSVTDEALAQEAVEAVTEGAVALTEDEKKQEDVPQSEPEKNKEGEPNEEEEKEPEDKEMTLEEYEKVLEEKRKALFALKAQERKVEVDKELRSMQQLSVKKDSDKVFIKLGSDKEKKKENIERDERAKKSLSINEFLKPADGERYYSPGGRGRSRGRGRGDRGGYQGGHSYRGPIAVPSIEDQAQFPTLCGK